MKKVKLIIIGAGNRGNRYASYSIEKNSKLEIVGICEPNEIRREKFSKKYKIKKEMQFENYEELFKEEKLADAVAICTQDQDHFKPLIGAKKKNYHILIEKPVVLNTREYNKIVSEFKNYKKIIAVCHVLRYTKFFRELKKMIKDKKIGEIQSISHYEDIGYFHFAHSFVRGNWRNEKESSPILLAKSCHDLDILNYLVESKPTTIYSSGKLKYFTKNNSPKNAAKRCIDCKLKNTCKFSALTFYNKNKDWYQKTDYQNYKNINESLKKGPYGKCVYYNNNNVNDMQSTIINYENGVHVQFMLNALSSQTKRQIKIYTSNAEIFGDFLKNEINIKIFGEKEKTIKLGKYEEGHGGGDFVLMKSFVKSILTNKNQMEKFTETIESHHMAFKAEESRKKKKEINI